MQRCNRLAGAIKQFFDVAFTQPFERVPIWAHDLKASGIDILDR